MMTVEEMAQQALDRQGLTAELNTPEHMAQQVLDQREAAARPPAMNLPDLKHPTYDPKVAAGGFVVGGIEKVVNGINNWLNGKKDKSKALSTAGVELKDAPGAAQAIYGLGDGITKDEGELVQFALDKAYGKRITVVKHEASGQWVYRDPDTGKPRSFNVPSAIPSPADLAAGAGPALQDIGTIGGGLAGAGIGTFAAGGPGIGTAAGGAVGGGLGAGLTSDARAKYLKSLGFEGAVASPGEKGAEALIGGLAVPAAGFVANRLVNKLPGTLKPALTGLRPEDLLLGERAFNAQVGDQMAARTGIRPAVTSANAAQSIPTNLNMVADGASLPGLKLAEQQRKALQAGGPNAQPVVAAAETQRAAAGKLADDLLGQGTLGDEARMQTGQQVQQALGAEAGTLMAGPATATQQAEAAAVTAAHQAFNGALPVADAGQEVRGLLQVARDTLFGTGENPVPGTLRQRYADFQNRYANYGVIVEPFRNAALRMGDELNTLLPRLTPEDAAAIRQATHAGQETVNIPEIRDPTGNIIRPAGTQVQEAPVPLASLMKTRSDLGDIIANEPDGPRRRAYTELYSSLSNIRDDFVRQNGLEAEFLPLEAEYAAGKQAYNRGVVGSILERSPENPDGYAMPIGQIIPRLLNQPEEANALQAIVGGTTNTPLPLPAGAAEVQQRIRSGLLGAARDAATDGQGRLNADTLANFVADHENTYAAFFTPMERQRLIDPARAATQLVRAQDAEARALKEINARTDLKLAKPNAAGEPVVNASAIVDRLYSTSAYSTLKTVRETLQRTGADDALAALDASLKGKIAQNIMGAPGPEGYSTIDPSLLRTFLRDRADLARLIGGNSYVNDLNLLSTFLAKTDAPVVYDFNELRNLMTKNPGTTVLLKSIRVPLGIMTPQGRALTAAVGALNEQTSRETARLLADPKALHSLLAARTKPLNNLAWKSALGADAFTHLAGLGKDVEAQAERRISQAVGPLLPQ